MADKPKKPQFSLVGILSNEVTKRALLGFIDEIVLGESKVKAEREAIKDIKGEADQSLGIPSSILNKLVREKLDQGVIAGEIKLLEDVQGLAVGLGITEE
jgi:VIT1/CCC1 family predicted Fe2+/Mn2+ transporter